MYLLKKYTKSLLLLSYFLFIVIVLTSTTTTYNCRSFMPYGKYPVFNNIKLAFNTKLLCYSEFVILYSNITHGPLWTAEHLTHDNVINRRNIKRINHFHEEILLPIHNRLKVKDFWPFNYDRGHTFPAGDCNKIQCMTESFSMANIIPQNTYNNRHQWAHIEQYIRNLSKRYRDIFILTGPLFTSKHIYTIGKLHTFVPTKIYKVVYIPIKKLAYAIVINNSKEDCPKYQTINDFELLSGFQFPGIPEKYKKNYNKVIKTNKY